MRLTTLFVLCLLLCMLSACQPKPNSTQQEAGETNTQARHALDAGEVVTESVIGVVGKQYEWIAVYPGADNTLWTPDDLHQSGVIVLPAGRTHRIEIKSEDVLHALFIPAMRFRKDAVPGWINYGTLPAIESGEYDAYCAEYCGRGHAEMTAKVQVVSMQEFERHLQTLADSE